MTDGQQCLFVAVSVVYRPRLSTCNWTTHTGINSSDGTWRPSKTALPPEESAGGALIDTHHAKATDTKVNGHLTWCHLHCPSCVVNAFESLTQPSLLGITSCIFKCVQLCDGGYMQWASKVYTLSIATKDSPPVHRAAYRSLFSVVICCSNSSISLLLHLYKRHIFFVSCLFVLRKIRPPFHLMM